MERGRKHTDAAAEQRELAIKASLKFFRRVRSIRKAAWERDETGTYQILSGRCEETDGTWLGISIRGRVAFLVDAWPLLVNDRFIGAERRTLEFLESNESPEDFAKSLAADTGHTARNTQISYQLIVADIASNSMFYISKPSLSENGIVHIEPVGPGVHTLSSDGLDSEDGRRDLHLKNSFGEMINRERLPPIRELARIMYDPVRAYERVPLMSIFVVDMRIGSEHYGTRSTTALVVKRTNDVMFFERYREKFNDNWEDHDFAFTII
ncbi:unnamed protein product [Arabidopsis lyrata]|uniref:Uncharacterized protein n=1 Tax=Arabidopsis lyrata subsp. lyrata TaxID=81972 RepID=D7KJ52_ARALL|nr:hypothetical protein ARALYDRAFT_472310 [Arabidopsis lyrata subsp. lyrata]CAH8252994.1 unnamed protein product [Arabidopsis lyrata]